MKPTTQTRQKILKRRGRRPASRQEWRRMNRKAIEVYNKHVEKHGAFSDGLRCF